MEEKLQTILRNLFVFTGRLEAPQREIEATSTHEGQGSWKIMRNISRL